ncbi:MAG: radical SAM protein [bacterium]|nr:radical SAM protein [bacterium]
MKEEILLRSLSNLVKYPSITRPLFRKSVVTYIYATVVKGNGKKRPEEVQKHKYYLLKSMIRSVERNVDKGYISKEVVSKVIYTLVKGAILGEAKEAQETFYKKYGIYPPSFIVLSPTQLCNLQCTGCYAAADHKTARQIPYEVSRRLLQEIHDEWGARFVTISGGEPLMYENKKGILNLCREFSDMYFLMYTNGTLITDEVAKEMAELANITPAISVEGYEKETDARRGKGAWKRILKAMDNLKKHGVPFGVSITGTRFNANLLTNEEFYDYYFNEIGASYMWIFQYMPIGRGINVDLMPTPEQRVEMFRTWQKCVREKEYFVADFWNSGVVSDGCIAYGRPGGYIYIDWNGNIMPCVFVPYYVDNIFEIYKRGSTISDALFSEFFKRGREWQFEYGYEHGSIPQNWLMPCSIRDHYKNFKHNIARNEVKPEDENAEVAFKDPEYEKKMIEYDERLRNLTEKIWKEEFLKENLEKIKISSA